MFDVIQPRIIFPESIKSVSTAIKIENRFVTTFPDGTIRSPFGWNCRWEKYTITRVPSNESSAGKLAIFNVAHKGFLSASVNHLGLQLKPYVSQSESFELVPVGHSKTSVSLDNILGDRKYYIRSSSGKYLSLGKEGSGVVEFENLDNNCVFQFPG